MSDDLQQLKADGLDLLRTETQRELRKFNRRVRDEAVDLYNAEFKKLKPGAVFNPEATARTALAKASGALFQRPALAAAPLDGTATPRDADE